MGRLLELNGEGFSAKFDLSGTARLLVTLATCVQDQLNAETTAKGSGAPAPASPATADVGSSTNGTSEGSAKSTFTGTGIIVSTQGQILTNDHVIEQCTNIVVRRAEGNLESAQLTYRDATNDLALLKVSGPIDPSDVASLRIAPALRAGEQIAVYGFPLAGTLSESGNIVGGNVSALAGMGDDARYFQITAPIQPGNSGGPLLDMEGDVAGVVNMKLDEMKTAASSGDFPQNVNFAIKGNVATNFLDAHGVEYSIGTAGAPMDLASVADRARRFTVLIVCQ
jgi:S1-C subfamily serine protease